MIWGYPHFFAETSIWVMHTDEKQNTDLSRWDTDSRRKSEMPEGSQLVVELMRFEYNEAIEV